MSDYRATETDMRMSMLNRGYTEAQVSALLGEIKAEAWDAGFDEASDDLGRAQMMRDLGESNNPYRGETA